MGRASAINKRTSHITIVVSEKEGGVICGSKGKSNRYAYRDNP